MRSRNVMLYLCHERKGDERETHDDNNCRTRRGKSQLCLGSPFLVQEARRPRHCKSSRQGDDSCRCLRRPDLEKREEWHKEKRRNAVQSMLDGRGKA